jgi:DNA-binding CsgD family transcriptional regulator
MYENLRSADFRAIFQLLGECREQWIDPDAWQRHLLEGVSRLVGLPVGLMAEVGDFQSGRAARFLHAVENGWENPDLQQHFHGRMEHGTPFSSPLDLRFRECVSRRGAATLARADLMPDADWRSTRAFAECYGPARMHELLYSAVPADGGSSVHLLFFGGDGHRPTERDRQRLAFLHGELVSLLGTRLAGPRHISLHGLSPRRRQVFGLLLDGLSEKLIADRLGLRQSTVSEYIQKLYQHFRVHSRGELLAYALRMSPTARGTEPRVDTGHPGDVE